MSAPRPVIHYRTYNGQNRPYLDGEVPIHSVHEVTASYWSNGLRVHVRGPMRKKDGTRGAHERGCEVDLSRPLDDWLAEIVSDAKTRLP